MKAVSLDEFWATRTPDFSYDCSVLIEGLLERNFCVTDTLPASISEVVQALYETMAGEFGAQQLVAVQTSQSQAPQDKNPLHIARIAYIDSGKSVAYILVESIYSGVYASGLSYISICLPIEDCRKEKSKKVISTAWPYIKELSQAPVSADKSCILQVRGGYVVSSGHDKVISGELGLDLPKKPLLIHPHSCRQPKKQNIIKLQPNRFRKR